MRASNLIYGPGLSIILAMMTLSPAAAVTVHTWVDTEGVRHFSDVPPGNADLEDGTTASQFEVNHADAEDDAADDYYSINSQWARLHAEREAEAERKLERERIRAEERTARQAAIADERYYQPRFNGYFPYGGGFGFGRPPRPYYGDGSGAAHSRNDYAWQRRQRGFSPTPVPQRPTQR